MKDLTFTMAWKQGGFRERKAMEIGTLNLYKDHRNHIMWKFTYSPKEEYQDANGATYDVTEGVWVG